MLYLHAPGMNTRISFGRTLLSGERPSASSERQEKGAAHRHQLRGNGGGTERVPQRRGEPVRVIDEQVRVAQGLHSRVDGRVRSSID